MRRLALSLAFTIFSVTTPAFAEDDDVPPPSPNYVPPPATNAPLPELPPIEQQQPQQPQSSAPPPYPPPPPQQGPTEFPPLPPGYQQLQPQPIGYVTQRRWNLFVEGAGIFGSAWIGNIVNALTAADYIGTVPLAGPWLMFHDDTTIANKFVLGLDGVAQAAGLTLMILGVSLTKKVPVYGPRYSLVPTGNGMALMGSW